MAIFDISYVGEMPYLKLTGGTVTGATTFNDNLAVSTINGVTVGSNPQFTDTTYSVATTSANGLLPALGGGTTNYLRADGSWAKPVGTTYSVATTSANGLMAAADKVAVNKIGSGTLNTTNKTIIPAINELKSTVDNDSNYVKTDKIILRAAGDSSSTIALEGLTSVKGNFQIIAKACTTDFYLHAIARTSSTSSGLATSTLLIGTDSDNYVVAWIQATNNHSIISLDLPYPTVGGRNISTTVYNDFPGAAFDHTTNTSGTSYYYPLKPLYLGCTFWSHGVLYGVDGSTKRIATNSMPLGFAAMNESESSGITGVYIPSKRYSETSAIRMDIYNTNTDKEIALYITYI